MLRSCAVSLVFLAAVLAPRPVSAQEATPRPAMGPAMPVPSHQLRVEVEISRYEGEREVARTPNSFLLPAYPRETARGKHPKTELRMGVEVPIPVTTFAATSPEGGGVAPATSFQYRNVGTNLVCRARETGKGVFEIELVLEASTVYAAGDANADYEAKARGGRTMFRTFNVVLRPLLRDGQSVETVASADPVTGEVVKVNVSMKVVK